MIFGEAILRHDAVASTQDIARDLARGGAAPGMVVTARFQTRGRGRHGRTWHAVRDANVILTAIGAPVPAAAAWQVALVAGVAVAEGVAKVAAAPARVRFPNDVYLEGRKLAGILVETVPAASGAVVPLIGIGVNVRRVELPEEVRVRAVSLEEATGVVYPVVATERAILRRLSLIWEEWEHAGFAATLARWKSLADPDARRVFVLEDVPTECQVRDLTDAGDVVVETGDGRVLTVPASQVVLGDV